MAKMESTLKNMLISLGGIALVCALLLAVVNALTEKKIARVQSEKTARAIAQVLPAFEGAPIDTVVLLDGTEYNVHKAMAGGSTVGYAVESVTAGFGGPINLMVGFNAAGDICSTAVISHSETPGLGAKITEGESHFRTQFDGRNPAEYRLKVTKDGGDVDAITASTITSRAFTAAVEKAYNVYLAASGSNTDAASSATAPQDGEGGSDEAN
ncbi:MAG: RnfABCDGE type electron transport complex subunit G [Bacteroidales bacterium]|nr:RnfABCDGE type electron transport complex subunit G [Bacteroidales bacterium]MBQ6081480.1 RnfABCDGE type electron transport complex subunit G [Bacteroidales bacterium]MBQ7457674.1 RnfABCDGE type electron transport complex subunit G [Bacteroidales bacterium]MBQ9529674.1 RnfABCDGE type electron transport complex subunit G [Bacteroidales bacterium]